MPRKSQGPRLWLREQAGVKTWYIKDGSRKRISTGCAEDDHAGAEKRLAQYISEKHQAAAFEGVTAESNPSRLGVLDVLSVYAQEHAPTTSRPAEIAYHIEALSTYWQGKFISEVRGETCRAYVKRRSTQSMARRELETLRAAINYFHKEYSLEAIPAVTLPEKEPPRERWLTRPEAARLLWAAHRTGNEHVKRLILIGIYTGTRSGSIMRLQWLPNTTGGWVDIDKAVMHRKAREQRTTKKRQPPAAIPDRLLPHLKRWHAKDAGQGYVITWKGRPIQKMRRSWSAVREAADLDAQVIPHVLRHTCATWLMQKGVDLWQAAGFLGMTKEQLEETYGHHHPDYQAEAKSAF